MKVLADISAAIDEDPRTHFILSRDSGVSLSTISRLRRREDCRLYNIEAVANTLGYDLALVARTDP